MTAGTKRWRSIVASALLVGVIGGGLLATQSSASPPKTYTVGVPQGSPTKIEATATPTKITITNTTRNPITFAAANLDFPVGLTVTSPSLPAGAGTATIVGQQLQLREMSVGRGSSVTVSFDATATGGCQSFQVTSDVRQSNNFAGTDNKFSLSGAEVVFEGPCNSVEVVCKTGSPCTASVTSGDTTSTLKVGNEDVDATLTAELLADQLLCRGAPGSASAQLVFDITPLQGWNPAGKTKTVTFTFPKVTEQLSDYQVCFRAPYQFPAFPIDGTVIGPSSSLVSSINSGVWDDPSRLEAAGSEWKGLLVPCSALAPDTTVSVPFGAGFITSPAPCVDDREPVGTTHVKITIVVPAADPGGNIRF